MTSIKHLLAALAGIIVISAGAASASPLPEDGRWMISVSSSSSMFRVVKCELIVEDGRAEAVITLGGKGFSHLYAGTGEEAEAAGPDAWAPARVVEKGRREYTVPVSELDSEIDLAARSKKYEKWFDHKVRLRSETLRPADE